MCARPSQPYGGHQGQQTDIGIAAKEVLRQRDLLEGLYWEHCKREGESVDEGKKRFRPYLLDLPCLPSFALSTQPVELDR